MLKRIKQVVLTPLLMSMLMSASIVASGQCLVSSNMTITPPLPVSGVLPGGTTIEICFEVIEYNNLSANWFHGIGYTWGPGWDVSTLTPTVFPTSCSGSGTWDWYTSVTSLYTGGVFGPGFFYEQAGGSPGGVADLDPGNNFGDNCTLGMGNWIFCVQITTNSGAACVEGDDLTFVVEVYSDGESGNWSSAACAGEPGVVSAPTTLSCCEAELTPTNPSCIGDADGQIIAVGTTTGPFTFDWSTAFSETSPDSSTIGGLSAGVYDVTITDAVGCMSVSSVELFDPPPIDISLVSHIDVACIGGSNGSIEITGSGGTGLPITYSIDGGAAQPTGLFTGLAAGTYTFSAIDSLGCTHDTMITLIEANVLTVSVTSFTDATCFQGIDGTVTAAATGGYAPYMYSIDDVTYLTSPTISGLAAGTYTIYVQDDDGCVVSTTVTIGEPAELTVDAGTYIPIPAGGSVLLSPTTPATAILSWLWSPPTGLDCTACENPIASPTLSTWYTVLLTDANGCTAIDSAQIIVSTDIPIPNAFTPNGDQLNDIFTVRNPLVDQIDLSIYNRWGTRIFHTDKLSVGWDGTFQGVDQEMGSYIYSVNMITIDGLTLSKHGTITLVR